MAFAESILGDVNGLRRHSRLIATLKPLVLSQVCGHKGPGSGEDASARAGGTSPRDVICITARSEECV